MDTHIIKQSLVNNLTGSFSTGYVPIDMLFTVIVSGLIGLIISNLSKASYFLKKIRRYCKKKEYTVTVEDISYLTKDGSGWVTNEAVYGDNVILIKALFFYLKEASDYEKTSGNVVLDNNKTVVIGTQYDKEKNKLLRFKPTENIKLINKFSSITLIPIESTEMSGESVKQTTQVIVKSTKSIEFINEFLKHCYDSYVEKEYGHLKDAKKKKYFLLPYYTIRNDLVFEKIIIKYKKSFDNIFFPEKERLINTVDKFMRGELKQPKCSILLEGPPGTGKTTLIKILSEYTDRHPQIIKLSEIKSFRDAIKIMFNEDILSCNEYHQYKSTTIPINQRILIFEDIDVENKIVHDRNKKIKNKNDEDNDEDNQLSLSDVLQLLDGLIEIDGLMVIITTNSVDTLDPALIRPGRVTMRLHLGYMKRKYALDMIKSYYPDDPVNELFNQINDDTISPAQLENFCNESNTVEELLEFIENFYKKL